MPEPKGETLPITPEQRKAVKHLLFQMLSADDPTLTEDKEIFRYQFTGPTGKVTIDFEPDDSFIDWAITTGQRVMKETLEQAALTLVSEGKLDSDIPSDPKVRLAYETKNPEVFSASVGYIAMQSMIPKLKMAFYELVRETEKIVEGIVFLGMKHSKFDEQTGFEIPDMNKHLADLAKELANTRKKQLIKTIDRFTRKPRLHLLAANYPQFLKIWQSIRKIYRANSESETWRDMVKAKYPDLPIDDDLLTRITGNVETLSDEIRAKLDETDGDETPSSIALEHCARLLGAAPYQHSTRHYYRLAGKTSD